MFLTVTGFVIGCDSDDGPKVTAPAQAPSGGGSGTPTRDTTAETQGREQLEVNEFTIRNKSEERWLTVRFSYPNGRQGHYIVRPSGETLRDVEVLGTDPTLFPCSNSDNPYPGTGNEAVTARANGECWRGEASSLDLDFGPVRAIPEYQRQRGSMELVIEIDNGRKIKESSTTGGSVIIRFNYPEPKYYSLEPAYEMSSDPEGAGPPPRLVSRASGTPGSPSPMANAGITSEEKEEFGFRRAIAPPPLPTTVPAGAAAGAAGVVVGG